MIHCEFRICSGPMNESVRTNHLDSNLGGCMLIQGTYSLIGEMIQDITRSNGSPRGQVDLSDHHNEMVGKKSQD